MAKPFILGIGGTLRSNSSSEKALWVSLRAAERHGAEVAALAGEELDVAMYAPERDLRSEKAARLVELMRACDGIIVSSPSYHGGISGLVKNALDYTEDMRSDTRAYFEGRAFGSIACAAGWQGVGATLVAMRSVAHALRAWPTPMGAGINTLDAPFDASGACTDASALFQLELVGRQVVDFARMAGPASAASDRPRLSLATSR